MTDKELRKLKRSELMEILYYLQKEVETLQKENESLKQQLGNAFCNSIVDSQSHPSYQKINCVVLPTHIF